MTISVDLDMTNTTPERDAFQLKRSFKIAVSITAVLWLIKIAEFAVGARLGQYGVYPGQLNGLAGVLLAPLVRAPVGQHRADAGSGYCTAVRLPEIG